MVKQYLLKSYAIFVKYIENIINIILKNVKNSKNKKQFSRLQSAGENVRWNGAFYISEPEALCVGSNVYIGDNANFKTEGGLSIGDNTHISRNCVIYTAHQNYHGDALPYDADLIYEPVTIGRNVWIGMNVRITPGVSIGDGAIIGMGSVVAKDVPELSIFGDSPSKHIKKIDKWHYLEIEKKKLYGGLSGIKLSYNRIKKLSVSYSKLGGKVFFIVTTGRSGSTSIASALNENKKICCRHEHRFQLVRLSTELAHKIKPYDKIRSELSNLFDNSSGMPGLHYGESNQKYFNLITIVHELLPKAKFIWLIRDGRDVVASTFARGWFKDDEYNPDIKDKKLKYWQRYRLNGNLCCVFDKITWKKMSLFERNCWYWSYVNEMIETQLKSIPDEQKMMINLQMLDDYLPKLLSFIGVKLDYDIRLKKLNVAKKRQTPKKWTEWTEMEINTFNKYCGDGQRKWLKSSCH